jgi:hypothetical protein
MATSKIYQHTNKIEQHMFIFNNICDPKIPRIFLTKKPMFWELNIMIVPPKQGVDTYNWNYK